MKTVKEYNINSCRDTNTILYCHVKFLDTITIFLKEITEDYENIVPSLRPCADKVLRTRGNLKLSYLRVSAQEEDKPARRKSGPKWGRINRIAERNGRTDSIYKIHTGRGRLTRNKKPEGWVAFHGFVKWSVVSLIRIIRTFKWAVITFCVRNANAGCLIAVAPEYGEQNVDGNYCPSQTLMKRWNGGPGVSESVSETANYPAKRCRGWIAGP